MAFCLCEQYFYVYKQLMLNIYRLCRTWCEYWRTSYLLGIHRSMMLAVYPIHSFRWDLEAKQSNNYLELLLKFIFVWISPLWESNTESHETKYIYIYIILICFDTHHLILYFNFSYQSYVLTGENPSPPSNTGQKRRWGFRSDEWYPCPSSHQYRN